MKEEKQKLPPLRELLEQMYGKKITESTPEELERTRRGLEEWQRGQEDIPPKEP